jgi:adenylate cyclase
MFMAFSLCVLFTVSLFNAWWVIPLIPLEEKIIFILLAVFVPSVTLCFIRIIEIVGSKHFIKFFLGTYYVPKNSDLVIIFIDMVGSAEMAERMDAEKNMMFISQFIYDASSVFKKNGGDILNFTGDGLLVTWPRNSADKAFEAIKQLQGRFNFKKEYYLKHFNALPEYRIGGHAGKVTMAQIGDGKLFLALCGDVVNAASRIEELNKRLQTNVLLSEDFIISLKSRRRDGLVKVGKERLRGKTEELDLYTFRDSLQSNNDLEGQLRFNF